MDLYSLNWNWSPINADNFTFSFHNFECNPMAKHRECILNSFFFTTLFLESSFRFTAKVIEYINNSHISLAHTHSKPLLLSASPTRVVHLIKLVNPHRFMTIIQIPQLTLGFTLGYFTLFGSKQTEWHESTIIVSYKIFFLISLLIASFHFHPSTVNHLSLFCLHNFAFTGFSWNIVVIIYRETFQIALFHLKYGFKILPSLPLLDISFTFINSAVSILCVCTVHPFTYWAFIYSKSWFLPSFGNYK